MCPDSTGLIASTTTIAAMVWGSDIFYLHLCNLLTGLPASALALLYEYSQLRSLSEPSAQNSPVALHVTQDQSQNPYNG